LNLGPFVRGLPLLAWTLRTRGPLTVVESSRAAAGIAAGIAVVVVRTLRSKCVDAGITVAITVLESTMRITMRTTMPRAERAIRAGDQETRQEGRE
jgi:hypothetical protein